MIGYASKDQAAAIGDLAQFDGELIEVAGRKVRAHIERNGISQEGSQFGLDNREETLSATLVHRGNLPSFDDPVTYRGKPFKITEIKPEGNQVVTLSLTND